MLREDQESRSSPDTEGSLAKPRLSDRPPAAVRVAHTDRTAPCLETKTVEALTKEAQISRPNLDPMMRNLQAPSRICSARSRNPNGASPIINGAPAGRSPPICAALP